MAQIYRADAPHYRLVDGIWAALVINTFIRHAESVELANFAQLVNTIGLVLTYDDKVVLTPQYHAMKLYGDALQDRSLPLTVDCGEVITSKKYSRDFPATTSPTMDATATISKDGKRVSIFIVNKHFTGRMQVTISLADGSGIDIDGGSRVTMLVHDDPFACNTREDPARITLQTHEIAVESGTLLIDMPPHSVASIEFSTLSSW